MIWRFTVRQINKQKEPACMPDIRREVQRIIKEAGREEMKPEHWDEVKSDQKRVFRT